MFQIYIFQKRNKLLFFSISTKKSQHLKSIVLVVNKIFSVFLVLVLVL